MSKACTTTTGRGPRAATPTAHQHAKTVINLTLPDQRAWEAVGEPEDMVSERTLLTPSSGEPVPTSAGATTRVWPTHFTGIIGNTDCQDSRTTVDGVITELALFG